MRTTLNSALNFKSEGRNPTIELRFLIHIGPTRQAQLPLATIDSAEIDDAEIKSAYDFIFDSESIKQAERIRKSMTPPPQDNLKQDCLKAR